MLKPFSYDLVKVRYELLSRHHYIILFLKILTTYKAVLIK